MKYLCVTHVPVFAGQSPGMLRFTRAHLRDLLPQAAALREAGFDFVLATPLFETIDARTLAHHEIVTLPKHQRPFSYVPLPGYRTMPQFLSARNALLDQIRIAASDADIVQLGAGGHPMALGQVAWPVISKLRKKRVFVFGSDPFPALAKAVTSGRNPAKRLAKQLGVRQFEKFCANAIKEADLVFTHTTAIADRFRKAWADHCHVFDQPPLTREQISRDLGARAARLSDNSKPVRLVSVGETSLTKGVDHLLRSLGKARRLSAKLELDLIGDLTQSADLMDVLRAEKLENAVRLRGRIDLTAAFDEADAFVASSLIPQNDPIIYTAAARGLPIVTYQSGSPAADAQLTSAGCAVVVERGDSLRLAQALLDLARDRTKLIEMSRQATEFAYASTIDAVHERRAELALKCVKESSYARSESH